MDWVGDHARPRSRILRNDHESTRRDKNGPLGRKRVSRASELPALRSTNRTKNSGTVGRGMGASYREVDAIYQPICGVRSQLDKLLLAFGVDLIYTHENLSPELMDDSHHEADNEPRPARHCQRLDRRFVKTRAAFRYTGHGGEGCIHDYSRFIHCFELIAHSSLSSSQVTV